MSNIESIIKYEMGATTSVAGQQPYKTKAGIEILSWKLIDHINDLKTMEFTVPNDEFHRANVLIERNVNIPFITPMNGIIVRKQISDDVIKIKVIEDGFHLDRRIWRKGTLYDETTNNNHGTATGTTTYVDGRHARAFSFNDSTYITLANETQFDFERTSSFSMGGWIKVNAADVGQYSEKTLYDKISGVVGIRVYFGSDNLLYISLTNTATSNQVKVHYATSVMTNDWIHVFVTSSGTSNAAGVKLYVNGAIVTLVTDVDNLTSSILHNVAPRLGYYYKGLIDEWRVYNAALNATRANEVYNNTEDLTNLVSRHQFNSARHDYSHTGINVIAQAILDDANTDQPAGITWTLETGTPTTEVDFKAKFTSHWEALQSLADTGNCDLWLDTQDYKVNLQPLKSKGKTLNEVLDLVISSVPELNLEEYANQINVLGKNLGSDKQIESITEVVTDLKYKYETVMSSSVLDTQANATGVAERLLLEHKLLTPVVKAVMPYDQFVRYVLETGDEINLVDSRKELSGKFRIMEIKVSPKQVNLLMESADTAVSPTRKQSLTDIINIMLERIKTNEIVG